MRADTGAQFDAAGRGVADSGPLGELLGSSVADPPGGA